MRKVFRLIVMAWLAACLPGAPIGEAPAARPAAAGATIEPAPPLLIDMRALPAAAPDRGAARGRLEIVLDAGPGIADLTLALALSDGVAADEDPFRGMRPITLAAGGTAAFVVPIRTQRSGRLPIRLTATYRLEDGTPIRSEQADTWRVGPDATPGRSHAGAWEVMAVPLESLPR